MFKKLKETLSAKKPNEPARFIQNFNAPVGAVLNGSDGNASVNQTLSADSNLKSSEQSTSNNSVGAVTMLVERFLSVFESHAVKANQIPKLVSKFDLKISDFTSYDAILRVLSDELVEWTCETFGIERAWLEGESDWSGSGITTEIYDHFDCYKNLHRVLNLFESYDNLPRRDVCLYAFKNGKLERDTTHKSIVALVFREKFAQINQRPIYRNKPVTTYWQWDYWKMRYQIKAIFMLCKKYGVEMRGFDLPDSSIDDFVGGRSFPEPIINNCFQRSWHPEDYVDEPQESRVAKQSEEISETINYLEENQYTEFLEALIRG